MVKESVIFKSLDKEASEEVESVIQKVTAVEVQAEIISSDTGTCRGCLSQMFGPELHEFYVMFLQCISVHCSIHEVGYNTSLEPSCLI